MNYERFFCDYKDELELAFFQNSAVECELYSVVASIIRTTEGGRKISLRDVTARRTTINSKPLKGIRGFPDFVVLKREKQQPQKEDIYGCVEIKNPFIELNLNGGQIEGHINSYKKVLYTNGLKWIFIENRQVLWEKSLGTVINNIIQWDDAKCWFDLLNGLDSIEWI